MNAPIFTLTDFGLADPYVGLMEAVILRHDPSLRTISLTHAIAPGDLGAASFWLEHSRAYLPKPAVLLAVVDPGVGTKRRGLALQSGPLSIITPDNGLLSDFLAAAGPPHGTQPLQAIELDPVKLQGAAPPACGHTFHGRDVFAPAAALLATGKPLDTLGRSVDPNSLIRSCFQLEMEQQLQVNSRSVRARIVDHFGNIVTDLACAPNEQHEVSLDGQALPWVRTYGEAEPGTLVALRGSFGTLEIAKVGGNARRSLLASAR